MKIGHSITASLDSTMVPCRLLIHHCTSFNLWLEASRRNSLSEVLTPGKQGQQREINWPEWVILARMLLPIPQQDHLQCGKAAQIWVSLFRKPHIKICCIVFSSFSLEKIKKRKWLLCGAVNSITLCCHLTFSFASLSSDFSTWFPDRRCFSFVFLTGLCHGLLCKC